MYSATRVNQFEMKDTCFQFVINVSLQGSNVKIKYSLKINLQRFQSCLVLLRHIHNPVKQACKFIKKRHQHKYFSINIAKFLRVAFLKRCLKPVRTSP